MCIISDSSMNNGGIAVNEALKKKLREILLACYNLDVDEAKCFYSTQNYAFIFPGKPYMLRVSMTGQKTRAEILSEQGMPLTIESPDGGCVLVMGDDRQITVTERFVTVETVKGERITLLTE